MKIDIISLAQELSFEGDGGTANFLVLRLPNGAVVRALITDESAREVAGAFAGNPAGASTPAPAREAPAPSFTAPSRLPLREQNDGSLAAIFGGDEEDSGGWISPPGAAAPHIPEETEEEDESPLAQQAWVDPSAQAAAYAASQKKSRKLGRQQPRTMINVPKDEMGYPIVRNQGGGDMGAVTGNTAGEEDGIGQF
jgi:hypothetical protein